MPETTPDAPADGGEPDCKPRKTLGLALGSGAARGWAHVGVLRALDELGLKPDVIAGCSVGALVGGAHLVGALDDFAAWARELKPLSALNAFALKVHSGGFVDAGPAFDAFAEFDRAIGDLPVTFGAAATDLGIGEEVWVTEGSLLTAVRASSAIPVLFHSVRWRDAHGRDRWLVDGALTNPVPVSLARALGADVVIGVDLNAVPRVIDRFNSPPPSVPALVDPPPGPDPGVAGAVAHLIDDTRRRVDRQIQLYRSRADAAPHLFETAYAAADIFQMHLARARAQVTPADIALAPDMRDALPTAFDRADEFVDVGRAALLARADDLARLLAD
ncbi:MAG: patatin-like phospholipase family protein [Pseudomonadota bacterium]